MESLDEKTYSTLCAQFAILGHVLARTIDHNGVTIYFVSTWGYGRLLTTFSDVQRFLVQVGGPSA